MTEMKISLPKDLLERMKNYPKIKWENIARVAVENYLKKLENIDIEKEIEILTKLSEQSLKEFLENEPDLYSDDDLRLRYQ